MAASVQLRHLLIPLNKLPVGQTLDSVLTNIKPLVIGGVIYHQELETTDWLQQFADCIYIATPANDATIVSTLIPPLSTLLGATVLHYSIAATA